MIAILMWTLVYGVMYFIIHKLCGFTLDKVNSTIEDSDFYQSYNDAVKLCADLETNPSTGLPCSGGIDGRGNFYGFNRINAWGE